MLSIYLTVRACMLAAPYIAVVGASCAPKQVDLEIDVAVCAPASLTRVVA